MSGITPWVSSGSMNRAPSAATRMSQRSARWNDPPMDHPCSAAMIGASISKSFWMPRCPRRINSWWLTSTVAPMADTSRPVENE